MGFGRVAAIVGLALLMVACQATTPPGNAASPAVAVNASPTARPSSAPSPIPTPTFTPGPTPPSARHGRRDPWPRTAAG